MSIYSPEYYAPCDGPGDDAAIAIQAALDATGYAELDRRKSYYPRRTIFMPNDGSVIDGGGSAKIVVQSAYFNNNNPYAAWDSRIALVNAGPGGWSLNSTGRYGTNSVVIMAHGALTTGGAPNRRSAIQGVRFVGDNAMGLCRYPILARNTHDFRVEGCEFSGFGLGVLVGLAGCVGYRVVGNTFRDCYESGIYPATSAGDAADCAPNITAIATIDDFISQHGPSIEGLIADNNIARLLFSGAGLARHGHQSDGINLAQAGQVTRTTISRNRIASIGEGIDCFEKYCSFATNNILDAKLFGKKFTYGASFNSSHGDTIVNSGAAAIILDSPAGSETRNNLFVGEILYNAQSAIYPDNSLIQLSASGSGSTHSNTFVCGEYAPQFAKTVVRNTANALAQGKNNRVSGRILGQGTHADPAQRFVSYGSADLTFSPDTN